MQYLQKYFSVEYGYISVYKGISQNTHNVISTYIRRLYDVVVLQPLKQRCVSTVIQYLERTNISKILHKASVTLLSLYTRFITKVIITNNLLSNLTRHTHESYMLLQQIRIKFIITTTSSQKMHSISCLIITQISYSKNQYRSLEYSPFNPELRQMPLNVRKKVTQPKPQPGKFRVFLAQQISRCFS